MICATEPRYNEVLDPENADPNEGNDGSEIQQKGRKLVRGRNIFDTQAARVGFIVACAVAILGRVGMDKDDEFSQQKCIELESACATLVAKCRQWVRMIWEISFRLTF